MLKPPRNKKAQTTGTGAATLVALIALLILFYLLFIPPSVRDELLEGNISDTNSHSEVLRSNGTFLLESPGTLTDISTSEIEHKVPNINLFATSEAKLLDDYPSVYIKSNMITKKTVNVTFEIDDLEHTDHVLLSFNSKQRVGNLIIHVNGVELYNSRLESANINPIELKTKFLKDGENTLDFSVSSVGFAFWKSNSYDLTNIQITADVTDVSEQKSKNIFIVSTTENNNLDRSIVRFTPECVEKDVGLLEVMVNGHEIYSAVPECGVRSAIEVQPNRFRSGENNIMFRTEKGNYLVDLISITSELKEPIQPVYYFDINQTVLDDVATDVYDVVLKITFADDVEYKEGTVVIDGRETGISQYEKEYRNVINEDLLKGNNAIKIMPDSQLDIVRLEVIAEEK